VLGIDWQRAPFTRCLVDNALLRAAEPHHAEQVPPSSRSLANPLRLCPTCGRLYWPGGHVRRMQHRLSLWKVIAPAMTPNELAAKSNTELCRLESTLSAHVRTRTGTIRP
jgi:hypothetical protein